MPEPGIPGWTEEQHDKLIGLIERGETLRVKQIFAL